MPVKSGGLKWRNSKAKAQIKEEIIKGTIDDATDLKTLHNMFYSEWPWERFNPNVKNLLKAFKEGKFVAKKQKWSKSKEKDLLRQWIIDKTVTDDTDPAVVYKMDTGFEQYKYRDFKSNLERLKESVYKAFERMEADCIAYGHDLALLKELRAHEAPGFRKTPWHSSDAKPLLEKAIKAGENLKKKPSELYKDELAYREYTLKEFRKHIYQAVKKTERKEIRFVKKKKRMKAPATTVFSAPARSERPDNGAEQQYERCATVSWEDVVRCASV